MANLVLSQDFSALGGDLTSDLPDRHAIQVNAPNISSEERRILQLSGFAPFHRFFSKDEGLGPRFSNSSCGGCHVENGKSEVDITGSRPAGSTAIVKVGLRTRSGFPRPIRGIGNQIPLSDAVKVRRYRVKLEWREQYGRYPDGTRYSLRRPRVSFRLPSRIDRRRVVSSLRMSSPMIGMGLLESVPDETLISLADPLDLDGDGISGRVNVVPGLDSGSSEIGRFGFKALHPTVEQQAAAAFFKDMGLTTRMFKESDSPPEISDDLLFRVTMYLKLAGVPRAREQDEPPVRKGREVFNRIGCSDCHKIFVSTRSQNDPELDSQLILPYSNLLLHDMGRGLSDGFNEFGASGKEWRTTPLWGLGHRVSDETLLFLHDGRARTVEEAILWHGGEARKSRDRFKNLSRAERKLVILFLNSL